MRKYLASGSKAGMRELREKLQTQYSDVGMIESIHLDAKTLIQVPDYRGDDCYVVFWDGDGLTHAAEERHLSYIHGYTNCFMSMWREP